MASAQQSIMSGFATAMLLASIGSIINLYSKFR